MADLTLYHALFSTCSQKVRFALGAKQLAHTDRLMSLADSEHLEDWYLAINPNGVVPTLKHGDAIIVDSSVICEYLDDAFPAHPLSPADPVGVAQMRAWMRYFEEVPTTAIRAPSFNTVFIKSIGQRSPERNHALRERMPLRKHFYAKMGQEGFAADVIEESTERLASCVERVERALATTGPYLLGAMLTLADVVLLPSVVRMEDLRLAALWDGKPHFAAWYATMQAEPGFAAAYPPGARLQQGKAFS